MAIIVYLKPNKGKADGTYQEKRRLCKSDEDKSVKCSEQENKKIFNG